MSPRNRYTESGERIDNITDWALKQVQKALRQEAPASPRTRSLLTFMASARSGLSRDLCAEFEARVSAYPLVPGFLGVGGLGRGADGDAYQIRGSRALAGSAHDTPDEKRARPDWRRRPILSGPRGGVVIGARRGDGALRHARRAWHYRFGDHCLDWILDQHKEKTPRDPTIREKFNTYRFADYKERVADLVARVARVSVETMAIVAAMAAERRE